MFFRNKPMRSTRDLPTNREVALRPFTAPGAAGRSGLEMPGAGLTGLSASFQAMADHSGGGPSNNGTGRNSAPDPSDSSSTKNVNFDQESDQIPQPYPGGGVPEDMATLVLNNPAMGSGPVSLPDPDATPGFISEPQFSAAPHVAAAAADPASDAAIMLRVAAGDESGFNYLVAKYHRPMIHFLFRMVRNQAVAEELAQEVFLRVYRSRESYRADAKFTTWLYRIATNLAVNHARDTKHERAAKSVYLDAPDAETGTTPDVADDEPTVEQRLLTDERMAAIRKHVMELPERQRMAVLMHKYQGLDYRQIGEVLKLSESATKSLLFRAYQTLRDKLKNFV